MGADPRFIWSSGSRLSHVPLLLVCLTLCVIPEWIQEDTAVITQRWSWWKCCVCVWSSGTSFQETSTRHYNGPESSMHHNFIKHMQIDKTHEDYKRTSSSIWQHMRSNTKQKCALFCLFACVLFWTLGSHYGKHLLAWPLTEAPLRPRPSGTGRWPELQGAGPSSFITAHGLTHGILASFPVKIT